MKTVESADVWSRKFLDYCITPRSLEPDVRRREFMLNVLLCGFLLLASVALGLMFIREIQSDIDIDHLFLGATIVFWLVIAGLLVLSRHRYVLLSAVIFVGLLQLSGVGFAFAWGFGLADAELFLTLAMVVSGMLFRGLIALGASVCVALTMLVVASIQLHHYHMARPYWRRAPSTWSDAIGFVALFAVMAAASWLFNREIDRSLRLSMASEAALQRERDTLEAKVAQRTGELEQLQLERLLELQPFAEFGRVGAGLLHDITNPLTVAVLHLEELDKQQHSELARQARRSIARLERYLLSAHRQLKREADYRTFSVGAELRQVTALLAHTAHKADVQLLVDHVTCIKLYGDVVKFDRLIANLVSNAIEAAKLATHTDARRVRLQVETDDSYIAIHVCDNGPGVPDDVKDHVFEPFYSTKTRPAGHGLGIGLMIVKEYVSADFGGTVSVQSTPKSGTTFSVRLPRRTKAGTVSAE